MDRHLTDEDLILHFYGEGPQESESYVNEHLAACAACHALWDEITGTLKMVDAARVPEPAADFEAAMWARVQAALPDHRPARVVAFSPRKAAAWLVPALGIAAAIAIAVSVGRSARPVAPAAVPAPATASAGSSSNAAGRERVLLTALDDHFQRSEMLLTEVMNGGTAGPQLAFDRQTADDLLDSGRLYRQAAQQNGNVRLAQMLEELESVLVEIARSPETVDRKDVNSLRARIEDDNLLFKVRAVSKQIQDRQRSLSTE